MNDITVKESLLSREEQTIIEELIARIDTTEEAVSILKEVHTLQQSHTKKNSAVFMAELYGIEALCYRYTYRHDEADQCFVRCLELLIAHGIYHGRFFKYYHHLVCTNLDKPDRMRAKEFALKGLNIAYDLHNEDGIAIMENTIAIFFRINSQPEESIPHLEKALHYGKSEHARVTTYLELGSTHKILENYDEAKNFYSLAEKLILSSPTLHYLLPYLYMQLAGIEEKLNCDEQCLYYIEKGLQYAKHSYNYTNPSTIFSMLCIKFRAIIKSDNLPECSQILDECMAIYNQTEHLSIASSIAIYEMQSLLHEKMGNYKQALDFYKQYSTLQLKDEHAAAQKGTNELKTELAVREQQKEKETLERELLLKNSQLKDIVGVIAKKNEEIAQVLSLVQSIDAQQSTQAGLHKKVAHIGQKLHKALNSQESWNVFDMQFSSLHPDFTKKLLELCPQLSKTELRLCCLLRADLGTKSIASLMHLENETIDQYRHRLRRKLKLPPRTDLNVFMQSL